MIKLTQRIFELKKEVQEKINRVQSAYERALNEYEIELIKHQENTYGEAPIPPSEPKPIELKVEDYNEKQEPFYVRPEEIKYIGKTLAGDTVIAFKGSDERITVLGEPEEIATLLKL
jgi:hypothetical protein